MKIMKPTNMNLNEAKLAKSTEHTPWKLHVHGPYSGAHYTYRIVSGGDSDDNFSVVHVERTTRGQSKDTLETFERIVEAVNNYATLKARCDTLQSERDELVVKAKSFLNYLASFFPDEPLFDEDEHNAAVALTELRKAIALCDQKEKGGK